MAMDRVAEIKRKKEASYQGLQELLEGLDTADWTHPVHGHEAGWTVRDLLSHLVTAGSGLLRVAQLIAEGRLNMRPDFDLDFWNQRQVEKQAGHTIPQMLDGLAALNRDVLAYLDTVAADKGGVVLDQRGQHAVFGEVSAEYILRRIYRHEREHAAEVRQALHGG
jgi:hypothetical protein